MLVACRLLALAAAASALRFAAAGPARAVASGDAAVGADDDCSQPDGRCAVGLIQHQAVGQRHRAGQPAGGAAPSTMLACRRTVTGALPVQDVSVPTISEGQALVRVQASSVNPIDWKLGLPGPVGRDFSGVVSRTEGSCDGLAVGDAVWGDAPSGAFAEYVAIRCDQAARRPQRMSAAEAGASPHVSLTALQALSEAGAPWRGAPAVLVLGGSGGVGNAAIQLAKQLGAGRVITTTSEGNFPLVLAAGADEAIDYHAASYWEVLGADSVDVVLDAVGEAETGNRAYGILRSGGHYVTLVGEMASMQRSGVTQSWCRLKNTGREYLDTLKGFAEAGNLKVNIAETFGLDQLAEALTASRSGHSDGKISIRVAE